MTMDCLKFEEKVRKRNKVKRTLKIKHKVGRKAPDKTYTPLSKKELSKLKTAYKNKELEFNPDEIARSILNDKYFRRGLIE